MSWSYFNAPWKTLESILSDRHAPLPALPASPRKQVSVPGPPRKQVSVPYAELHCHSNFSFLDGASHPEELVTEAARIGLEALALTDHNGFYGIVRFAEAARAAGLRTVFGAELTLSPTALSPTALSPTVLVLQPFWFCPQPFCPQPFCPQPFWFSNRSGSNRSVPNRSGSNRSGSNRSVPNRSGSNRSGSNQAVLVWLEQSQ